MIGRSGERGSGISVIAALHDDDDDDDYHIIDCKQMMNSQKNYTHCVKMIVCLVGFMAYQPL